MSEHNYLDLDHDYFDDMINELLHNLELEHNYFDDIFIEFLHDFANSAMFHQTITDWLFLYFRKRIIDPKSDVDEWVNDYTHPIYSDDDDYKRLSIKYEQSMKKQDGYKIVVYLPSSKAPSYYENFSIPQLSQIMFGYWYGLTEEEVSVYAKKNWSSSSMELVMGLFFSKTIPNEEVLAAFEGKKVHTYKSILSICDSLYEKYYPTETKSHYIASNL